MKNKSMFEEELVIYSLPWMTVFFIFACFYLFYFSNFPFGEMTGGQIFRLSLMYMLVVTVALFGTICFMHFRVTKPISEMARSEAEDKLTENSRTVLVRKYMELPGKLFLCLTISCFFAVAIISALIYFFFVRDKNIMELFFTIGVSVSYMLGLCGFYFSERLCSKRVVALVRKGVDVESVRRDKIYGKKIMTRMIMFLVLVCVSSNWTVFFLFMKNIGNIYADFSFEWVDRILFTRMPIALCLNCASSLVFSIMFYMQIISSYKSINITLENILRGNRHANIYLPSDLGNEVAYNFFITNEIVNYFNLIVEDSFKVSDSILQATEALSVMAKVASETASDDKLRVQKCQEYMAESKQRLDNISAAMTNVSDLTVNAQHKACAGHDILQRDIMKKNMTEICETNIDTISGLKFFNDSLNTILASISDIDAITEKIKIIAFNAELQTTKAEENSESFHVLGTEFRRIASTTSTVAMELKEYILSVKELSENLLVTSEVGTQKISKGTTAFNEQAEKNSAMRSAIDMSAESSKEIHETIHNQNDAFRDINSNFGELSRNFTDFSETARYISDMSEKLRVISNALKFEEKNKNKISENLWGGGYCQK